MLPFTRARDGGTSEAYTPSRAGDKDCCAAHVHSHGGSNSVKRKTLGEIYDESGGVVPLRGPVPFIFYM